MSGLDRLAALFHAEGAQQYLGEPVTQAEHMLQAATLAAAAGEEDELVVAALLHDVGHFHGAISGEDLMAGIDNRHSDMGADLLSSEFGEAVTEPVRLHVAAKRFLCCVDPGYAATLSEASVFTLAIQGGPMGDDEAEAFVARPYHEAAIRLRRYDDDAKVAGLATPSFADFLPLVERVRRSGGEAAAPT